MQLVPGGSPDPEWVQLASTLLLISSSSTVVGVRLLFCFNENSDHQDALFSTTLLFISYHDFWIMVVGLSMIIDYDGLCLS